jgi:hypothetical protein
MHSFVEKMYKSETKHTFLYIFLNIYIYQSQLGTNHKKYACMQAFEKSRFQIYIQNTIVDLCEYNLGSLDVPTTTTHLLSSRFM